MNTSARVIRFARFRFAGAAFKTLSGKQSRRVLAGAALALVSTAALSETPVTWLMRLNDSAQDLSYRGSFVYRHGNEVEAMRIVRRVDTDGATERLLSLSGATREVIRDQRQVWCYLPDENRGVHQGRGLRKGKDSSFPSLLPESVSDLQQFYRVELGETSRIAERDAQQVMIYPKDAYRFGHSLWIDVEKGLLLRADLVSERGEALEQYMFVEVDYSDEIADAELKPVSTEKELIWQKGPDVLRVSTRKRNWAAEERPDGFRLVEYMRKPGATATGEVHHLVYSDGLATVSVFVDTSNSSGENTFEGESRMGAVSAFGTQRDEVHITALGEVPPATVRLFAGAMRLQ